MGINITQFAPPGTVSNLVWDDDMKPGAGKVFKGDLTGNVTGDVTGDLTGNVTGLINAPFTVSETDSLISLGSLFDPTSKTNTGVGIFSTVVVDGLQAKIGAKLGTPLFGIINPLACEFPFDFKVEYVANSANIMTVSAKDKDGNVLETWVSLGLAQGTLVCAIPAGTDKIEAAMTYGASANTITISSPRYYARY